MHRTRITLASALILVLAACSDDPLTTATGASDIALASGSQEQPGSARVTSTSDAGPGTFRAAIEVANADPTIATIQFADELGTITLASPVEFTGSQALQVQGRGATIDAAGTGGDGIRSTGGAELTVRNLRVENAPGNGIEVDVPAGATGVLTLRLDGVTIVESGEHGVFIEDQVNNSSAGLLLDIQGSLIEHNGYTASDFDGVRANEGGLGSIELRIHSSRFLRNGADGLEMDERGDGGVTLAIESTHFEANGPYDPTDFDDGIDIDEADAGDIVGRFVNSSANGNFDQGFDLNENGAGDLRVRMSGIEASRNGEQGIEFEEDDDDNGGGDLVADLTQVVASSNGDDGIKLEEDGAGDLLGTIVQATASDNGDAGAALEQEAPGGGQVRLTRFVATGNSGDPVETSGAVEVTTLP